MALPVRVLIVDDSAFMRKVIRDLLESDPGLEVAGTARDGLEALEQVRSLQPDVVTMDVEMPRLDGLSTLRRLMAEVPRPVVMLSSLTDRGAQATMQALSLGAIDFVHKPSGAISLDLHRVRDELVQKVKAAARVTPRGLQRAQFVAPPTLLGPGPTAACAKTRFPSDRLTRLVVVAASTGGPGALHRLLAPIPSGLSAGVLVIQHMPQGFTRSLAGHLDQQARLTVREAAAGDRLTDGVVLVAPGGSHLLFNQVAEVSLDDGPPRHGVRPAADVTMEKIPDALARRALVVILTGMGMDGARGAKHMADRGAEVWVQDEESCVVFGMPRTTRELGIASRSGPPEQLGQWLGEQVGR